MRIIGALHDLALAILVGSIAGVSIATITLFDRAPSREFAGQVGNGVFETLALLVLILTLIILAARFLLRRGEPSSAASAAASALSLIMVVVAAVITLWITPAMGRIWAESAHAPDGSGLMGADRARFMWLHGLSSAAYLGLFLAGAVLVVVRSLTRAAR